MFKKIGMVLALLLVGVFSQAALADTHYDGFTALSPEGLPAGGTNTWTWADIEASNGYWGGACAEINKEMQANIPCTIDHKAWQDFYAAELKRPQKIDRVNSHPGQFCGASGLYYFSSMSAITQNDFLSICSHDAACKAEFLGKVKAINCTVETSEAEPSLKLENGTLTFVITRHANGDTPNGDGWVKAHAKKLFPAFSKLRP